LFSWTFQTLCFPTLEPSDIYVPDFMAVNLNKWPTMPPQWQSKICPGQCGFPDMLQRQHVPLSGFSFEYGGNVAGRRKNA
jgi:hypothetical protein